MVAVETILEFIKNARVDTRLKPVHVSVYLALYQYWVLNSCSNPIEVSRRNIMQIARIKGIATYHKVISELTQYGYIDYFPSYDPRTKTAIYLKELGATQVG